jgi:hypothetical protein
LRLAAEKASHLKTWFDDQHFALVATAARAAARI